MTKSSSFYPQLLITSAALLLLAGSAQLSARDVTIKDPAGILETLGNAKKMTVSVDIVVDGKTTNLGDLPVNLRADAKTFNLDSDKSIKLVFRGKGWGWHTPAAEVDLGAHGSATLVITGFKVNESQQIYLELAAKGEINKPNDEIKVSAEAKEKESATKTQGPVIASELKAASKTGRDVTILDPRGRLSKRSVTVDIVVDGETIHKGAFPPGGTRFDLDNDGKQVTLLLMGQGFGWVTPAASVDLGTSGFKTVVVNWVKMGKNGQRWIEVSAQ